MGRTADAIGANVFQYFTRNPRGGSSKSPDPADIAAYQAFAEARAFGPALAHAPYTLNACAAAEQTLRFCRETMAEDLSRLEALPGSLYNFHPGCHVGQGTEVGIALIAETLNLVLRPEQHTVVLLETMAGKGSEVGGRFEELRAVLDRVELRDRVGVCLDTCHVSDAGYDLFGDPDGVIREFDKVIGLDRLRAIHVNDSKNPPGSHKDRHELLGRGYLGTAPFRALVRHPLLRGLPFYLETPNDLAGYSDEIRLLRTFAAE